MKNDGVCVYYFEKEEIEKMFEKVGLVKVRSNNLCKLLQNRKRNLKMYRVWLQCLFYKPPLSEYLQ
jgi:tRNAThr (cytosine32-N3)-methyltransferase